MFIYKKTIKIKTYSKLILCMLTLFFAFACNNKSEDANKNKIEEAKDRTVEVKNQNAGDHNDYEESTSKRITPRKFSAGAQYNDHLKNIFENALKNFRKGMTDMERAQRQYSNLNRFPFLTPNKHAFNNVHLPPDIRHHINRTIKKGKRAVNYRRHHKATENAINDLKEAAADHHNHPFRTLRKSEKALEHEAHIINNIPKTRRQFEINSFRKFKKHLQEHIKEQEKLLNLKNKNPHISGVYLYSLLDPFKSTYQNSHHKIGIEAHHFNVPLTKKFGYRLRRILIPDGVTRSSKLLPGQIKAVNRLTEKMDRLTNHICKEIKEYENHNQKKRDRILNRKRRQAIRDEEKAVMRHVDHNVHKGHENNARIKMEKELSDIEHEIKSITTRAENRAKGIKDSHRTVKEKIKEIDTEEKRVLKKINKIIDDTEHKIKKDVQHTPHEHQIINELEDKIHNEIKVKYVKRMKEDFKKYKNQIEKHGHKPKHKPKHKHPIIHKLVEKLHIIKDKHKKHLKHAHEKHIRKMKEIKQDHLDKNRHMKEKAHRREIHHDIQKRIDAHHESSLKSIQSHQQLQIDAMKVELKSAMSEIDKLKDGKKKEELRDRARNLTHTHREDLRRMTENHKDIINNSIQKNKDDIKHIQNRKEEQADENEEESLYSNENELDNEDEENENKKDEEQIDDEDVETIE